MWTEDEDQQKRVGVTRDSKGTVITIEECDRQQMCVKHRKGRSICINMVMIFINIYTENIKG